MKKMVRTILYDFLVYSPHVILDACLGLCQSHLQLRDEIILVLGLCLDLLGNPS